MAGRVSGERLISVALLVVWGGGWLLVSGAVSDTVYAEPTAAALAKAEAGVPAGLVGCLLVIAGAVGYAVRRRRPRWVLGALPGVLMAALLLGLPGTKDLAQSLWLLITALVVPIVAFTTGVQRLVHRRLNGPSAPG